MCFHGTRWNSEPPLITYTQSSFDGPGASCGMSDHMASANAGLLAAFIIFMSNKAGGNWTIHTDISLGAVHCLMPAMTSL